MLFFLKIASHRVSHVGQHEAALACPNGTENRIISLALAYFVPATGLEPDAPSSSLVQSTKPRG